MRRCAKENPDLILTNFSGPNGRIQCVSFKEVTSSFVIETLIVIEISPCDSCFLISYTQQVSGSPHFHLAEVDGVLAAAEIGVYIWDLPSGISTWNAAMFSIFEISEKDFNESPLFWRTKLHPDDVEGVEKNIQECLTTDRLVHTKCRIITGQGKIKILRSRSRRVLDSQGKVIRVVGVNIDVTETIRAQEDLALNERTLFQARQLAQMAVWEEDLTNGELSLSSELRNLVEKTSRSPGLEEFMNIIVPEDRERVQAARAEMFRGRHAMDVEYRIQTPQLGVRYRHSRAELVFDSAGKPIRVMGVTHDLTERRRAEEERFQLQQRLLQVEKLDSLGTFAGGIAHDFNNFLAAISGQLELAIEQGKSAQEMGGVLERVLKTTHRAQDLVSRILTFSKVPQLRSEQILVQDLIRETMEILEASISSHIALRVDASVQSFGILGDRVQVQQVLINIVTNAVQAIGEQAGGIHITSSLLPASQILGFPSEVSKGAVLASEYACIQISDTGPGIEKDHLKKIFDPMFTTKSPKEGTGLGLSVSQSIIRGHGGWIAAASEPGQGTCFKVYVPVTHSRSHFPEPTEQKYIVKTESAPRVRKLLLVDDDIEVLSMLVEALETQQDLQIAAYSDSTTALQAFRSDPSSWSMVVSDLTMPGLNGVELCHAVHMLRPKLPVILITGFDRSQVMNQMHSGEPVHILLKPFRMNALREMIQTLLQETSVLELGATGSGPRIA